MRQEGLARLSDLSISTNSRDFLVMHFLIRDLKSTVAQFAKGEVLDIGCGNKPYEQLFAGKTSGYTGCDVVQSNMNRVDVICPATALDFRDAMFDTVFSTQVIEHVSEPDKMLREANRVLRPGGHVIISAPFCWELHEEPYDFYRYTKYGLQAMLKAAGFELLAIHANGGKWAALMQMNLNMVYSSFGRKSFARKLLKFLFIRLRLTAFCNRLALWMDRRFYDELLTLNYVAVGKKRISNIEQGMSNSE